jgi:hypothetical protein
VQASLQQATGLDVPVWNGVARQQLAGLTPDEAHAAISQANQAAGGCFVAHLSPLQWSITSANLCFTMQLSMEVQSMPHANYQQQHKGGQW